MLSSTFCRLDALEAAEEAHIEFLRSIAQKEAPDPIGAAGAPPSSLAGATNGPAATATDGSAVDASTTNTATAGRTRFWVQARASTAGAPAGTATPTADPGAPGVGLFGPLH